MVNNSIRTNYGRNVLLYRGYTKTPSTSLYLPEIKFGVGTGQADLSTASTVLTHPVTITGSGYKDFMATYPSLDMINNEATIRCLLLTTECNGNLLNGIGRFNSTNNMTAVTKHGNYSKSNTDQLIYIFKDQVI